MEIVTLHESIAEAERFLSAAKAAIVADAKERQRHGHPTWPGLCNNPRENGAVRRASMDLTRKLADLRAGR